MSYVENYMREQMAKHQLEKVDAGDVPMYWLKEPGKYVYSLLVTQLPVMGITLAGDLQIGPGRGGVVMAAGYDLEWFASDLSEGYLCSKFLQEEWSLEEAERGVRQRIRDLRADTARGISSYNDETRQWIKIARDMKRGFIEDDRGLADALHEAGFDLACDYWPGHGYNRGSAGWLCAAQQRFHELWVARKTEEAA